MMIMMKIDGVLIVNSIMRCQLSCCDLVIKISRRCSDVCSEQLLCHVKVRVHPYSQTTRQLISS